MASVITRSVIISPGVRSCSCGRLTNICDETDRFARKIFRIDYVRKTSQHGFSSKADSELSQRWRFKLRWLILPTFVGLGYYSYREMGKLKDEVAQKWQVNAYTLLPMNLLSRLWGKMHNVQLPVWMRSPVYKLYIRTFKVNLEEAVVEDLKKYKNLGEFFKRPIKSSSRPIDNKHSLVSPCDGRILHFGCVENGWVEQVKGVKYSLTTFIGPPNWSDDGNTISGKISTDKMSGCLSDWDNEELIKPHADKCLYHCVIYLAPGDYHGFHSPTEWTVSYRRHFPGKLLSVNPAIARKVIGLFHLNERVVYFGQWQEGLLLMSPVGATNVGSIKVNCDETLQTNTGAKYAKGFFQDCHFTGENGQGIIFQKGQAFGEFNLGSTIVLIFEAPRTFKFKIKNGQKIKLGEPIGCHKS